MLGPIAPTAIRASALTENYLRIRVSPQVNIAMGTMVMAPGEEMVGQQVEMLARSSPCAAEMDAYGCVLGDALAGEATLFARQDSVEEAWRFVDPVLRKATPVYQYDPTPWGPTEVQQVTPSGGWHSPIVAGHEKRDATKAA